jgi:hypothetical protein
MAAFLLHCTLVVNGTSRPFAATQQTVAFGGKAGIVRTAEVTIFKTRLAVDYLANRVVGTGNESALRAASRTTVCA